MSTPTVTYSNTHERERRHFRRILVQESGEFVWNTRSRIGRTKTFREFVTTENLAVKGAKIIVPGDWKFEEGTIGRFKLATEFCEAEVLEAASNGVSTVARLMFIGPSAGFIEAVQRQTDRAEDDRFSFKHLWSE